MSNADNIIAQLSMPDRLDNQGYRTETDGNTAVIETPAGEVANDFDQMIRDAGFDPDVFTLAKHPTVKTWDAQTPAGVKRLYSYRLDLTRKAGSEAVRVDDLVKVLHEAGRIPEVTTSGGDKAAVVAVGDLQLGKGDGDGTEGIVRRFKAAIDTAVADLEDIPAEHVVLAFLGDCIEGSVSQGGKVMAGWDMNLTEQLRLLRHLMTYAIRRLLTVCDDITVASVPGNHDETHRSPLPSEPTDSYAVDSLRAVQEAFDLAGICDVEFMYPHRGELTIELEAGSGDGLLLAHGHQWRTDKHFDWWKGQAFSGQTGSDARYLLAGHRHHFSVDTESERFFVQVPALESRSDWWRNKTGQVGNPGAVFMRLNNTAQPTSIQII